MCGHDRFASRSSNVRGPYSEPTDEELKRRGGIRTLQKDGEVVWSFGWSPSLAGSSMATFADVAPHLRDSGRGRITPLYRIPKRVWNRDLDEGPQEADDCVSWAVAGCVDVLACIEVMKGTIAEYPYQVRRSTEAVYGYSRNEHREPGTERPRTGSYNKWAVRAVLTGGTVSRRSVKQANPDDDEYEGLRAFRWGDEGVPDQFDEEATRYRVHAAARVTSFEEARDAIANGYPVCVASSVGFTFQRNPDGFAARAGTRDHAMKFVGARDDALPGLLCMNSMDLQRGPTGALQDIPSDAFWLNPDVCNAMFAFQDSFVLAGFGGDPAPDPYVHRVELISELTS